MGGLFSYFSMMDRDRIIDAIDMFSRIPTVESPAKPEEDKTVIIYDHLAIAGVDFNQCNNIINFESVTDTVKLQQFVRIIISMVEDGREVFKPLPATTYQAGPPNPILIKVIISLLKEEKLYVEPLTTKHPETFGELLRLVPNIYTILTIMKVLKNFAIYGDEYDKITTLEVLNIYGEFVDEFETLIVSRTLLSLCIEQLIVHSAPSYDGSDCGSCQANLPGDGQNEQNEGRYLYENCRSESRHSGIDFYSRDDRHDRDDRHERDRRERDRRERDRCISSDDRHVRSERNERNDHLDRHDRHDRHERNERRDSDSRHSRDYSERRRSSDDRDDSERRRSSDYCDDPNIRDCNSGSRRDRSPVARKGNERYSSITKFKVMTKHGMRPVCLRNQIADTERWGANKEETLFSQPHAVCVVSNTPLDPRDKIKDVSLILTVNFKGSAKYSRTLSVDHPKADDINIMITAALESISIDKVKSSKPSIDMKFSCTTTNGIYDDVVILDQLNRPYDCAWLAHYRKVMRPDDPMWECQSGNCTEYNLTHLIIKHCPAGCVLEDKLLSKMTKYML
jgi:hypothetical protein